KADAVRGLHDLLPRVRRQLALGQDPPDVVVQDLGGGARDAPEPARLAFLEELPEPDAETRGPVQDLHGAAGVDVDSGNPSLHRIEQVEIELARETGVQAALHADLGGPVA